MTPDEFYRQYTALLHALQTGVMYRQQLDPRDGTPKHLRVGINASKVDHAALVRLLIDRGIFTEAEYFVALLEEMKVEVQRYEAELSQHYGVKVTLG
jgi:hypothetical protein